MIVNEQQEGTGYGQTPNAPKETGNISYFFLSEFTIHCKSFNLYFFVLLYLGIFRKLNKHGI